MQVTIPVIYGIQALREFAKGEMLTNEEIAKRLDIAISYAVKVNRGLKMAGILHAVRGAQGGYSLVKPLAQVQIAELVNGMEGRLLPPEQSDTKDMAAIRGRLRDKLIDGGWRQPVSSIL